MINPFNDINWQPDRTALRSFGRTLVIGGIIGDVLFGVLSIIFASEALPIVQNACSVIAIIGIPIWIFPGSWAKPIYHLWFIFGASIGILLSNLSLVLFYYLFFTPFALLLRLTGRDPLQLLPPNQDSNWHSAPPTDDRKRYTRQY